jgi:hypothetical protein
MVEHSGHLRAYWPGLGKAAGLEAQAPSLGLNSLFDFLCHCHSCPILCKDKQWAQKSMKYYRIFSIFS